MRLIDADALMIQLENRRASLVRGWGHRDHYTSGFVEATDKVEQAPTVDAYTEEQVASIIRLADKADHRNRELEKECAWLKSCLNCKIRKECPRHCGKVVHDCDHWEYGDSIMDAVEVVHGRCVYVRDDELTDHWECSVCGKYIPWEYHLDWNYCPNCGAKMDLENKK